MFFNQLKFIESMLLKMKKTTIIFLGIVIGFLSVPQLKLQAQDTLVGKYGEDSTNCVMNNSLYYEFYRQWKQSKYKSPAWKDAIKPWRWVFLNCPKSTKNIYLHGEKLVEELIKNESDKAKKDKYIDTLMMVYAKRIEYFGNEGYVKGKWGSDLYKYRPEAYEEAYGLLKTSVELERNESEGSVLIYYFRSAEKMVKAEKLEASVLFDIYDQTSEIIEYNIRKYKAEGNEKLVTRWENVRNNIELSIEPYMDCPQIVSIYTPKFNDNPENVELLKKIAKLLDKNDCDVPLYREVVEKLHNLEPSAESAYLLGKMYIKLEDWATAAKYLEQAIQLYEDDNDKADARYLLANVYLQQKRYAEARSQCYEYLKVRPDEGKIYILIGDLYAMSANQCIDEELKVAYWPAVDMYIKAKNVDPSVEEQAKNKINTFSLYFPAKEQLFFRDLKPGDSYTVGCWINVTTTVRSSD